MQVIFSAICALAVWACGAASSRESTDSASAQAAPVQRRASTHDWTRFGWDASRSNASGDATGITAANVSTMRRQQVNLDGTVDASPIYLHGVSVKGATHDVLFVTTTYGKTLAIDANDGAILWRYTPPGYDSWAGSRQVTTAPPATDLNRQYIHASSPDD